MGLSLILAPVAEPVTIDEVKADLRIDHSDDDERLARLIRESRESIDGPRTWFVRSIMPQTWDFIVDEFPWAELTLPTAPVTSIVSVKYDAASGAEQTLALQNYHLDAAREPALVVPSVNAAWPATVSGGNAVRVRFVAGYEDADAVPGPIKYALRMMVQEMYDGADRSKAIESALSQYRLFI